MTPEIERLIGAESDNETACDVVERGAVRRYVQAYMDDASIFYAEEQRGDSRYGGPVSPALFPMNMFRRPFGTRDPFEEHARNLDFDGIVGSTAQGLPPLPLPKGIGFLNAGTEVEVFRYARQGESVTAKSRYASITEKHSSKGPMLLVVIETEYRAGNGDLLLRVQKHQIRR
ncbi:MAG: hypothetical protein A3F74_09920 [Betaproteobacteria bacterium RIFCSPLOWO2_12_FULL_62_58]|nr:MAG: hypothetical protein A3F74_09920 [Betaproteobacteria bacterium RIFCSPLOWO2_12_FULL_62_58]